jgi:hypothetical protein
MCLYLSGLIVPIGPQRLKSNVRSFRALLDLLVHLHPIAAFSIVLLCATAWAATSETQPTIEVLPAPVELLANGKATSVLVVLRNPTSAEIRKIEVSWLSDEGVAIVSPAPLRLPALAPHAETAWKLQFSQSQLDPVAGSVRLRIDYTDGVVPKIITQSIPVKSREPDSMDKFLDARIETSLETLDTSRPGKIDLFLTHNRKLNGPTWS